MDKKNSLPSPRAIKEDEDMNQENIERMIIAEYEKHHRIDWQKILAAKLMSEMKHALSFQKDQIIKKLEEMKLEEIGTSGNRKVFQALSDAVEEIEKI